MATQTKKHTAKDSIIKILEEIMGEDGDFDRKADKWQLDKYTNYSEKPISITLGARENNPPFCYMYLSTGTSLPLGSASSSEYMKEASERMLRMVNKFNQKSELVIATIQMDEDNVVYLSLWSATNLTDSMTDDQIKTIYEHHYRNIMSALLELSANMEYIKSWL